jgi:glucokinase
VSLTCGIDIGGTKIAGGVVDEDGTVVEELKVESPAEDVEAIEDAVAELVGELATRHDITAVGVGAAGYVDSARATVMFAPNLAWRDVDLKAELEERVEVPVVIENDANAAAWGEFRFGAGHDVDDLLLITLGTGVGGGLVVDGELYRGGFGVAAEIGHLRLVPGGVRCGCGMRGCFEQYASGSALERDVRDLAAGQSTGSDSLLERAGGRVEDIDGPMITQAAQDGDPFAVERLSSVGQWLGQGIASLVAVLDPAVVAIGGGLSEADELLLAPAREAFARSLPGSDHRPHAEIRKATLGNGAGLVGAADLARH